MLPKDKRTPLLGSANNWTGETHIVSDEGHGWHETGRGKAFSMLDIYIND